jgi:hypothetical protein
MLPSPSYRISGHCAEGSTANVDVGKAEDVAFGEGVKLTGALKAGDGVGVAPVDDGGTHAPRRNAANNTVRMSGP